MVQVDLILEPVADAVAQLIVFCAEEGEMPDLVPLSNSVSQATSNLMNVASDMAQKAQDEALKNAVPGTIKEIETSVTLLSSTCQALRTDPKSKNEKEKLVNSCKGILTGMTNLLEATDDAEVRKIIKNCQGAAQMAKQLAEASSQQQLTAVAQATVGSHETVTKRVGGRVGEITHPDLQRRLSNALEAFKISSTLLQSAARARVAQPDSASAKQSQDYALADLANAIKDIIAVVQIKVRTYHRDFDALKAGADAALAERVQAELKRLYGAAVAGNSEDVNKEAQQLVQDVKRAVADARQLAEQTEDPALRDALHRQADQLEALLPQVIRAAKEVLADPTNEAKKRHLKELCDQTNDAMTVLTTTMQDAREAQAQDLLKACPIGVAKVVADAKNGDKAAFVTDAKQLGSDVNALTAVSRELAEKCEDPQQRQEILDACDALDKQLPQFITAGKTVLANPNDADAVAHLEASAAVMNRHVDALDKALAIEKASPQDRAAVMAVRSTATMNDIKALCRAGDVEGAARATDRAVDELREFVAASRAAANELDDANRKAIVNENCDKIEKLIPDLIAASKHAAANPDDDKAQAALAKVIFDIEEAKENVMAALEGRESKTNVERIADINQRQPTTAAKLLAACKAGDMAAATRAAGDLISHYERLIALALDEAEKCGDPARKKLIEDQCAELRKVLDEIKDAYKQAAANPDDEAAQKKLADLLEKADQLANEIEKTVRGENDVPMPEPEQEEDSEEEEIVYSQDPLMAAAQDVQAESNKWDAEGNPMVAIANKMGELMAKLAAAAEAGDKAALINCSKEIAAETKSFHKLARKAANDCTDERRKKDLMIVADMIPTLGVQLKMVAAVKASTRDDDPTAVEQLVTCAQNLSKAVVKTVDNAAAASIKGNSNSGMKWRKKRGGGGRSNRGPRGR